MKRHLPALCLSLGLSTAFGSPAAAYPVDCAILLCLAGGWPASAECAHARAVFIARITPWPIEPPLQIWNCPMRIAFRHETPLARLMAIGFQKGADAHVRPPLSSPTVTLVAEGSDIDISDRAFDFVRSVRVFQIAYTQHKGGDGDCNVTAKVRRGTYGLQGDYHWTWVAEDNIPKASRFDPPSGCQDYWYQSVFVDWTDAEGAYGAEEVEY